MTPEKIEQQAKALELLADKLFEVNLHVKNLENAADDLKRAKKDNADVRWFEEVYEAQRLTLELYENEYQELYEQFVKLNTQPLDIVMDAGLTHTDTIEVKLNDIQVWIVRQACAFRSEIVPLLSLDVNTFKEDYGWTIDEVDSAFDDLLTQLT